MKNIIKILAILLLSLQFSVAQEGYEIVSANLPPWSIDEATGIFPELISEIEKRLGTNTRPTILPWSRAQLYTKTKSNHIIYPLTRVSAREGQYKWLINVMPTSLVFVTLNGKSLDLEEARNLSRIIVQQNSPPAMLLKKHSFTNLVSVTKGSENIPEMLNGKRAEAWFSAASMIKFSFLKSDIKKKITIGPPVSNGDLYIGTSKDFPEELAEKYRSAFQQVKDEGILDKILIKYLGDL